MIYPSFSYATLKYNKAWTKDLNIISQHFGENPIQLSDENILKLVENNFDFIQTSAFLLNNEDWKEIYLFTLPHWSHFNMIRDNAWDDYKATSPKTEEAMKKYMKVKSEAMLEFKKIWGKKFREIYNKGL